MSTKKKKGPYMFLLKRQMKVQRQDRSSFLDETE